MKKITALLLTAILLLNFTQMICFAEEEPPETGVLIEEYVNIRSVSVSLSINSSGTATIDIMCIGFSGTTHISSNTYLQKWNGSTWVRVNINGATKISEEVDAAFLSRTYTTTVGSGKYRVATVFTVTRGSDEIVTVRSSPVTH